MRTFFYWIYDEREYSTKFSLRENVNATPQDFSFYFKVQQRAVLGSIFWVPFT